MPVLYSRNFTFVVLIRSKVSKKSAGTLLFGRFCLRLEQSAGHFTSGKRPEVKCQEVDFYSICWPPRKGLYSEWVANQEMLAAPDNDYASFELPSLGMVVAASALFKNSLCLVLL